MSLNCISIMGNICNDIELKTTQNGNAVVNFNVAVARDYQSNGERLTDFFEVAAFGNTASFIERNFRKGQMIVVKGRMQSRKWEDRNGYNRTAWEVAAEQVYFGGDKKSENTSSVASGYGPSVNVSADDFDDEDGLPFD